MMAKIKEAINNIDEIYAAVETIKAHNEISKKRIEMQKCRHQYTEYQPKEDDTNTPESIICTVCGKGLPLPEPDDNI